MRNRRRRASKRQYRNLASAYQHRESIYRRNLAKIGESMAISYRKRQIMKAMKASGVNRNMAAAGESKQYGM